VDPAAAAPRRGAAPPGRARPRGRREAGTASVELALVLPLAVLALLLVAQVALVVSAQLVVTHAAREGAREAAVSNDDERARRAALRAGDLDPGRAEVEVSPAKRPVGSPVRVTVRYRAPLVVPYVSRFLPPEVTLAGTAVFRVEREADGP
jgi:Flp pilus assembly protein TadG